MIFLLFLIVFSASVLLYLFNKKQLNRVSEKWDDFSDQMRQSGD